MEVIQEEGMDDMARVKRQGKDVAFTRWSKKLDGVLFFLSGLFPVMGVFQWIAFEKGLMIGVMLAAIALFAFKAKKKKTRMSSFVAYFFFVIGVSALIDESGIIFSGYQDYSTFQEYMTVAAGVALIAAIFNFKTYAVTASLAAYWLTLFVFAMEATPTLSPEQVLMSMGAEYARLGLGGEYAELAGIAAVLFGVTGFFLHYSQRPKRRSRFGGGGGGFYTGGRQSNHSGGSNYFSQADDDDDQPRFSSPGSGSDNNHYGWSQSQIDSDNNSQYYGTPSWYQDKKVEENDYGKPWYARDEDDGFGRPSWARDDDDND